jgi:diadenosine tetraphosphate (Ap4A) HIT family hydrolase
MNDGWPANWHRLVAGEGCTFCSFQGQERTQWGARIFQGEYADGYLQSAKVQPGYTLAIWKGRHVIEPFELSEAEATGYWLETLRIARALSEYYQPLKLNYETLGNASPHLHTHLLPRYEVDPRPGEPFPLAGVPGGGAQIPEKRFLSEVEALRALLARPQASR